MHASATRLSKPLLGWAIAIVAVAATLGLGVPAAPAATCDTWTNAAGGAWETGTNWSMNAPPTSGQYACITMALSAPVVLTSSPTVAGLTLGGSSGAAELEANGNQTLTLGGSSTIADTGTLTNTNGTLKLQQTGTLTNDGVIVPASSGLQVIGIPARTPPTASSRRAPHPSTSTGRARSRTTASSRSAARARSSHRSTAARAPSSSTRARSRTPRARTRRSAPVRRSRRLPEAPRAPRCRSTAGRSTSKAPVRRATSSSPRAR